MPINENSYQIRQEFASVLKGFPGFRITAYESGDYFNIEVNYFNSILTHSCPSAACSRLPYHSDKGLVQQLLTELEKDNLNSEELVNVAKLFKKYLSISRQIDIEYGYNHVTPFIMSSFSLVLMSTLLLLPANTALIYAGLIGNLYELGFWSFLVWSLNKNERELSRLKDQLFEKIYFLRATSALSYVSLSPIYEEINELNTVTNISITSSIELPSLSSPRACSLGSNYSQFGYFYNSRVGSLSPSDKQCSSERIRSYSI